MIIQCHCHGHADSYTLLVPRRECGYSTGSWHRQRRDGGLAVAVRRMAQHRVAMRWRLAVDAGSSCEGVG